MADVLSYEDFAGGKGQSETSSSTAAKGPSLPANQEKGISYEEFSGEKTDSPYAGVFDKTMKGLKAVGGEAAALADFVLSVPGFIVQTGAQLGGTVQAAARGVPLTADQRMLNPLTAYGVGREAGQEVGAALMNPVKKVLDLFRSGEAYEQSKTTAGLNKLSEMIEHAGKWVEEKSGGQVSRDSVPMLIDTLMTSASGAAKGKAGGIPPEVQARIREGAEKARQQAEADAKAETLTPAEFAARAPVQKQINDMLGIRTPAEQAAITRSRRQDVKNAFSETGRPRELTEAEQGQLDVAEARGSRIFDTPGESLFTAEERMARSKAFEESLPKDEEGSSYEVGSKQLSKRVGQAEVLRILQKPGFERTPEDLIVLRAARQEGKASPEALALLSAAGIGAAVGVALDDDKLRGAMLGATTGLAPALLMRGNLPVKRSFGQAGAVKGPGGMWHPEAVERLATPLQEKLWDPEAGRLPEAERTPENMNTTAQHDRSFEANQPAMAWANKAIRNYLNKYAGTERDPLKDVEIPKSGGEGPATIPWEKAWDKSVRMLDAAEYPNEDWAKNAKPGEQIAYFNKGAPAHQDITDYLSHVGDYLRQNVKPEDLPRYDLVRAVRETAENDKRVAKQMEKAQSDSTKQLPVYKEYPDGFKWVELKLPEKLTEEQAKQVRKLTEKDLENAVGANDLKARKVDLREELGREPTLEELEESFRDDYDSSFKPYVAQDAKGNIIENSFTGEPAAGKTPEEAWLAGRLVEEGNTMGHCVGGYCEGVASGESRIFSLRDPKGKSHVTVEVSPNSSTELRPEGGPNVMSGDILKQRFGQKGADAFDEWRRLYQEGDTGNIREFLEEKHPEMWAALKQDDIIQIKGKQNRAPNAEYLPYVQDFIKSGKWGEVGDLENTGLTPVKRALNLFSREPEFAAKIADKFGKDQYVEKTALDKMWEEHVTNPDGTWKGPKDQRGRVSQEMVVGLTGLGLGGIVGWAMSDDPSGALLGGLAGASLALPGTRARIASVAKMADYGLGNLSTRIGNISEPLKLRAREYERRVLEGSYQELHKVVPLMQELNKLPDGERMKLERAILTGDSAATAKLMEGNVPLVKAWRETRNVLQELGGKLQGHGRFKTMLDDYFPRLVKDVDGLKAALDIQDRTRLEQALMDAEKRTMRERGTPLTSVEQSAIINREIQGFRRAKGYQPGYAKGRGVDQITEAIQPFYHTASESLYAYIRAGVQDLELARFFGRDLMQTEIGKQRHTNIEGSIGNLVGRELREGKIDHAQAQELIKMLQSRFQAGERSPNRIVQEVRNLGNLGLLGNVVSAVTQMSDTAMAIYAQDMRSTIGAITLQLSGKERLTARDFGLADHVAEEFVSQTKTAEWLNKMFKYSGFSGIDRFGKTTHINAALIRAERLSRTEGGIKTLQNEYGKAFGDEFPRLVADLRSGSITPRVRAYLFSELSDMQPVSKLEMPQGYLDNPNGRVMYMLKSFMLKQADIARRDTYNEIKRGNVMKGVKNLTEYALVLGIAGASTQMIQDWIMGREVHFDATDVMENALKTFGWSEYVRDKALAGKPLEAMAGMAVPPYRMMDDIIRRDPRAAQYIPIIGKLFYSWELGGKEAAEIARKKKSGEELSDEAKDYRREKREKAKARREAR